MAQVAKITKITVGLPTADNKGFVTYFTQHENEEAKSYINTFFENQVWTDIEFISGNSLEYKKWLEDK